MPTPDDAVAIDMHVHIESDGHGHCSLDSELLDASAAYFKSGASRTPDLAEVAQYYRERNMIAVVFTVDATTNTGHPAISSRQICEDAQQFSDVLIPFGSVDPLVPDEAARRVHSLVTKYGARGFKLHPSLQGFAPNDPAVYPVYEAMAEFNLPVVFHTGQTGIGAGLPGGRGIKLRYSDPMLIDDVAADFPQLPIILAHPSVPWQDAALSMATHKANVSIDLSGWAPKYFPAELVAAASGRLRHKMLFGTDFPLLAPERWLAEFADLPIKDEARPLILKENARKVLGI